MKSPPAKGFIHFCYHYFICFYLFIDFHPCTSAHWSVTAKCRSRFVSHVGCVSLFFFFTLWKIGAFLQVSNQSTRGLYRKSRQWMRPKALGNCLLMADIIAEWLRTNEANALIWAGCSLILRCHHRALQVIGRDVGADRCYKLTESIDVVDDMLPCWLFLIVMHRRRRDASRVPAHGEGAQSESHHTCWTAI